MITSLRVDGFKSLNGFELVLHQGLNVLVGPNGSGKTNICQALGLISAVAEDRYVEYLLSTTGGAQFAFTFSPRAQQNGNTRSVKLHVMGRANSHLSREEEEPKECPLRFAYDCELSLADELCLRGEVLKIAALHPETQRFRKTLTFRREGREDVSVEVEDVSLAGPMLFGGEDLKKTGRVSLRQKGGSEPSLLELASLVSYHAHVARRELRQAKVYNIDPHLAKLPSDVLEPMSLMTNGRGLANAIRLLEKEDRASLEEICAFLQNLSPNYESIKSSPSEDRYSRSFSLVDSNGLSIPAQSLSDGTVKLIALLVSLCGKRHSFVIFEEPENFLHPWVCTTLVGYLREMLTEGVCLMTTHSETILNSVLPAEIVVVRNDDGRTTCSRLAEPHRLQRAIRESGFGCGYHYVSGAFGGVP